MIAIKKTRLVRFVLAKWRMRSRTVTLTGEEWWELRRSVESDDKRSIEALAQPLYAYYPDLVARAQHSSNIRKSVLSKIPNL